MLWLEVDLTTVIPCLKISQLLIFVSCNVFKIVWLELSPIPPSTHTSLLSGRFSIVEYFAPFLKPRQSIYNTHKSQADGVFLEVPHFATSIYKSSKHFGLSFAYDAPKIWNDLPDDVRSATSLHSFRRKLKTYLFSQAYPPLLLLSLVSLHGADPCYVSGL